MVKVSFDKISYDALSERYKELVGGAHGGVGGGLDPYDIDTTLSTSKYSIDIKYMNEQFVIYKKNLEQKNVSKEQLNNCLAELHKRYAFLPQEKQKYAEIFIHDIESGNIELDPNKEFIDYIDDYEKSAQNRLVSEVIEGLGVDGKLLKEMLSLRLTEANYNDYARFDTLKNSINKEKAKSFLEKLEKGKKVPLPLVPIKISKLLKNFILNGGSKLEY
ncbi:MAG: hypothetical protein PUB15_07240 [Ruminobacter sp.]|nr:hypothetical protein [Ruminobacter sp.]